MEKFIKIKMIGTKTLIMHNCATVNPLHPLSVSLKSLTGKRNKTDEDLTKISDLEWRAGLYYEPGIGLYIPAENIEKSFEEGAAAARKGKDFKRGFRCAELKNPIDIGIKKPDIDALERDPKYRDVRCMRVKQARVTRTRPRFDKWSCEFKAVYDDSILSLATITTAVERAGTYIGICDSRPRYGSFLATVEEA